MVMTHRPFARALTAAGAKGYDQAFTYQDYLYELCAGGGSVHPVSEAQWEAICDMQGYRKLVYASNSVLALKNVEGKVAE